MSVPTGVKISALPPADAATIDDQLEVNQGGTSKRITLEQTLGLFGGLVGAGTVSNVSVVTANGLAGSVATASTTPAITLSTTITGMLKGDGTEISAAVAGTDYLTPTGLSETIDDRVAALLVAGSNVTLTYDDTANTLAIASTASGGGGGTVTGVSVVSANGLAGTVASATTTPAITLSTTVNGMLKGDGTALSAATAGTDYMTPANVSAAYQPLDADLTAVAALATTGVMARTAANTYTMRTITGTASRLSVTNGDGVAGNPTLNIDTAYAGQNTITTLGTITTGTWTGSVIAPQYLDTSLIAQNAQTGNYTTVLADAGKHLYHAVAAAAATHTIPANASVAYPIGTTLTFVNDSANAVTIAITTDTMVLSPGTTTGSRTLATGGVATAIKVTSTRWIINGTGLT